MDDSTMLAQVHKLISGVYIVNVDLEPVSICNVLPEAYEVIDDHSDV